MSFQGHIENGIVVLHEQVPLPNGTVVRIEAVEASSEKPEASGPVLADTEQPRAMYQMAQAWKAITRPVRTEETQLSVDPDDYPLF